MFVISCKHIYHPLYLGELVRVTNKCSICEQFFHPYWMQRWGLREEDMKKLAIEWALTICMRQLKVFFMEVTSTSTPIGTTFVTYPYVLPLKL